MKRKSKKELLSEKKIKEIKKTGDVLGLGIDEKVQETCAVLNLLGLSTTASCQGHLEHGMSAPWIEISALNEPEERFRGEKKIFQRVAKRYRIPVEDVIRSIHEKAYKEAVREASDKGETKEYKQWRKENKKLIKKASALLKEFYRNRKISPHVRVKITEYGEGNFRIHNGGMDYRPVSKKMTKRQKELLFKRLLRYQEEMEVFTKFLEKKYFS